MRRRFRKVEGLGNDFLLFDARASAFEPTAEESRALCDRHRGVGGDGVLVLGRGREVAARLDIWNADGSRAEMCGNGLRCAALILLQESSMPEVNLETRVGIHRCRRDDEGIWVELAGLAIGKTESLEVEGTTLQGRRVSLGNPHFVVFGVADAARAARFGVALERHAHFAPNRTNVEFVEPTDRGLRLRVWERGVGLTLACGTGAAAAAVVAWEEGRLPCGPTNVELPGGEVRVEPLSAGSVALAGPAREVYSGEVSLPE